MNPHLTFGPFRFEPQTARLWQDSREIKLTRKAAAVLAILVQRAGQPATKQELFALAWPDTVVGDDALVTCIQELRKALGDDAKQPRYIQTRHRSGYLFVAEVMRADLAAPAGLATETLFAPAGEIKQRDSPTSGAYDAPAIAVLPFVDMSSARDQDYFCEGLAEELIDALTHVAGLRVAARSSSFQFRGPGVDVREVGQRLGVSSLLEGSVRKAGDRLRITVQLIDVTTGYHKWSQRFERELGDIFVIQDEIAEAVATTLRGGALSTRERRAVRRQPTGTEPYECFLRGRQHMHRMQQPDMDQAQRMFERAIQLDAGYAPAWAGLATVHSLLYEWWGARDEDLHRAEEASSKAMSLAPDLADTHVARGSALALHRRYDEAQTQFEEAIRINPYLFDAYYYSGRAAFANGQIERSADLFRKASEVRQEDFQSLSLMSQSLQMLGREDEARSAIRECVARVERVLALNPVDGRALALGSLALHDIGQTDRALALSRRSVELYPDDLSALLNAACLHSRLGLKDEAIALIEKVFRKGWGKKDWIEQDPDYDSLRDDPRFIALFARLK